MSNAILKQYQEELKEAEGDLEQLDFIYRSMYYFEHQGMAVSTSKLSAEQMQQWATDFLTTKEKHVDKSK